MSRTAARALEGMIDLALAPLSAKRRAMSLARLMERLDAKTTHLVTTPRGPLRTLPSRGPHLAAAAVGFAEEEPETLAWIDGFAPGEVFYDVGAATGLLSMYAALDPSLAVYAFEPKATSYGVLVEHLALNDMGDRVFPLCLALGDTTELARLTLSQLAAGSGGNSLGGAPDQFGITRSVFSQGALAFRLDDLIASFALPPPAHVKIDVDGLEEGVLKGAERALAGAKSLLIEVEGENARHAAVRIEPYAARAGLLEDVSLRDRGSGRNRLYRRP